MNAAVPSTNKARHYQASCYERFCDKYGMDYLPCDFQRVSTYIAFLSFFMVYSSILNYLSGLSFYLKARGKSGIDYSNFVIRSALDGARRMCGKGKGKSPCLFPKDLMTIFVSLNMCRINDMVFWCAVSLAFRCLLRASNYCKSRHSLRCSDVVFVENGIIVKICSSKTNQFREFVSEIPVFGNAKSNLCPVAWLKDMLALRRPSADEMLFKIFSRGKWLPMSATWFNAKLRKLCQVQGASSHGLRRGGATFMLCNNFKIEEVKQRGLWKSACVYEYLALPTQEAMKRDKLFSLVLP